MARKTGPKAMATAYADKPAVSQDNLLMFVESLRDVTRTLNDFSTRFEQFGSRAGGAPAPVSAGVTAQINTWDDPFTEAVPSVNPPLAVPRPVTLSANGNPRLRTNIVESPLPAARYAPGTPGFRYWVAAEALNRGINFWGSLMPPGTTWSTTNPMRVILTAPGAQLNAMYRRSDGLHFFLRRVGTVDVRSAESPDVVLHELGHAVLDALRPQLFNVADDETGAFHESTGDISAILCALQIPETRQRVIAETGGRLNVNSRLSRCAEQLGWGIRQLSPTAVDHDSLRNAANRFFYRRPDLLPPSAPANLLSSEVHSFSRVFTGAFLDVLARMFATTGAPNEANLLAVTRDVGQLLVDAIRAAPITTGYFSQIAAAMIQADRARFGGRNRAALSGAFLERGILSVGSTAGLTDAPVPHAMQAPQAEIAPNMGSFAGSGTVLAYNNDPGDDGYRLGYGQTPELPSTALSVAGMNIAVHAAVQPPRFEVVAAATGGTEEANLDAKVSARLFVERLIQRREVDLGDSKNLVSDSGTKDSGRATHSLVSEGGKLVLKRTHFNCGCCLTAPSFACV
jgi:hypothetical protein